MPGMLRRVLRLGFNVSAVVSALLCVAVGGLWVRSYFATDEISRKWWPDGGGELVEHRDAIDTGRGDVEWGQQLVDFPDAVSAKDWQSVMLSLEPSREKVQWVRGPA